MRSKSRTFVEEARRNQIVAAAIEVLAESGYPATSLAAIANKVGISKGVISYHFGGKDDLLREVVGGVLRAGADYMTPRVSGAASVREALRIYITTNVEFLDSHRTEMQALLEVLGGLRMSSSDDSDFGQAQRVAVDALADLLQLGQKSGEFREFSPRIVAQSIRASIDAVPAALRADPSLDLGTYSEQLCDLYERAVRR